MQLRDLPEGRASAAPGGISCWACETCRQTGIRVVQGNDAAANVPAAAGTAAPEPAAAPAVPSQAPQAKGLESACPAMEERLSRRRSVTETPDSSRCCGGPGARKGAVCSRNTAAAAAHSAADKQWGGFCGREWGKPLLQHQQ